MSTKIGLIACLAALAAPTRAPLLADEVMSPSATGRVLVLDNERTLEGDIDRQGDQYRVRRSVGEVWIPSANVLRLCQGWEEAYAYLRTRANLRDPDERIRLAHWCQVHGLRKQAIEEAAAAVALRPEHAASRRLLDNMQKAALANKSTPPARAADETEASTPSPAVNIESLSLFLTRVQPIIMNTCASCHATGRGGGFKLTRTYDKGFANRKTTQQNLAAVLAQINKERPHASPLLTKAISVHGDMAHPPLKGREAAAYRTLEEWVRLTMANNTELLASASALPVGRATALEQAAGSESPVIRSEISKAAVSDARPLEQTKASEVTQPGREEPKEVGKPSSMPTPPEPVDPFDPLIFNRQMHPQGKPDGDRK